MSIYKTIYNFDQFYFEFGVFNLFNSVCKDWSTNLRRFSLLEGVQQMFFVLFPQEPFSRCWPFCPLLCLEGWDELPSAHYQRVLHSIKEFSTLDNKFATESVLQKYIRTVHVLIVENSSNFSSNSLMFPISRIWYLQLGRKQTLSSWRAIQYSLLTMYFSYVFAETKRLFFE